MPRAALAVDTLCEYKPTPGLHIRWRPARLLVLELHHVEVQPLYRGKPTGDPVRIPRRQVRAVRQQRQRQAIAVIQAARRQQRHVPGLEVAVNSRPGSVNAAVNSRPGSVNVTPVFVNAGPAALVARPKPSPPIECPAYLRYVQGHPCCSCGAPAPSEAHHWGPRGVSQKTDDLRTVPLCRRCHDSWHRSTRALPGRDRAESEGLLLRVQVGLLVRWASGHR